MSEIGEREAVKRIIAQASEIATSSNIGPGDDAAAVDMGLVYVVASTDLVTQSTHFLPGMTHRQMGWTCAAVNFSDIAAMGAKPIGILVSMGLPRDLESEHLDQLIEGILDCCDSVGAELLGGDTKESPEITLAGTAIGTVAKRGILLRKGARPGDLLAVTGSLGLAAAGYQSIMKGLGERKAEKAILEPRPRTKEGMILSAAGCVTSCMDVSDGLALTVHGISEASGVGFEVDYGAIPVEREVLEIGKKSAVPPEELILYYGGDYQLLFTFSPGGLGTLRTRLGKEFQVIGKVVPGNESTLIRNGRRTPLEKRGYEHFR
ncbi:MAG: thiamine-phosphate kinase [Methanomassiliicoccales archaeon]|nr:thiamine-phosphate kinase [Methanomassiliicoccales archaeon]